jgi:small subunit ribosomal protein S21
MLIIPVKEGESIEKALKKYKKKYERTGVVKELRVRQEFEKPSISRRQEIIRAAYREKIQREMGL